MIVICESVPGLPLTTSAPGVDIPSQRHSDRMTRSAAKRDDPVLTEKTHLNPSANYIHREIEFIRFLKKGISIVVLSISLNNAFFRRIAKLQLVWFKIEMFARCGLLIRSLRLLGHIYFKV